MELVQHRRMLNPFKIHGEQCIVVPASPHVIRIFYMEHVYDVLLTHDELLTWQTAGVEWQREYIRKILDDMINTECTNRYASIYDGYLA